MVVDDESLIREWLVMCTQLAGFSEDDIFQASNGEEALNLLNKYTYDIIFTDISMPKLNGIELIKAIREKDPQVKLVILTCHNDFSFARDAVKYNVYEYLLKNELTKDDIIRIINTSVQELTEQKDTCKVRDDFLRNLLHKHYYDFISQEELDNHYVNIAQGRYFVAAFNNRLYGDHLNLLRNAMIDNGIMFFDGINITVLIANLICGINKCGEAIADIENLITRSCVNETHIGKSKIYSDLKQLTMAMDEAMLSWELQFFSCESDESKNNRISEKQCKNIKKEISEKKNLIILNYENNGNKATKKLIMDLCESFANYSLWNSGLLKRTVIDILEEIESKLDSDVVNMKDYYLNILNASYLSEVEKYIENFFSEVPLTEKCIECIDAAKAYILIHYSEQITLTDIARRACLSEEYFSRLFKKETGKNFTEYLLEIRMQRAKQLLQSRDLNINEIADMVGIQNSSYFSSQFKRYYGVSPKIMRETV
jgi:YesN/AraC family two-component response regulator